MLSLVTEFGVVTWMAAGAALALTALRLAQRLQDRREIRQRGDWDSY
jgi:hypothetical protein